MTRKFTEFLTQQRKFLVAVLDVIMAVLFEMRLPPMGEPTNKAIAEVVQ